MFDFFRRQLKKKQIDSSKLQLDAMVYLLNYRVHYTNIIDVMPSNKQICELFLFRSWLVQFGYRIYCNNPMLEDNIIYECVNLYQTLGVGILNLTHNLNIESELRDEFLDLLEDRWQTYDKVYVNSDQRIIPTNDIADLVMKRLNITNIKAKEKITNDIVDVLRNIKSLTHLHLCK